MQLSVPEDVMKLSGEILSVEKFSSFCKREILFKFDKAKVHLM
jgi:hypothetical protein